MLPGGYSSVLQAKSREEFRDEVIRFTQRLGFETVSAITVLERAMGQMEFIAVDNTPVAFSDTYCDPRLQRRDPVMQHSQAQSVPIVWDQETYVAQGAGRVVGATGDIWLPHRHRHGVAHAGRAGISSSASIAIRLCRVILRSCSESWPTCSCSRFMHRTSALRLLVPATAAARAAFADAARTRGLALDHGRQDGVGGRRDPGHQRAHGGLACQQCDAQVGLRQQAPSGSQGAAPWLDLLSGFNL